MLASLLASFVYQPNLEDWIWLFYMPGIAYLGILGGAVLIREEL